MNKASSRDTASTTMTTAGRGHQKLPVRPEMNSNGTKAMILARILKITGRAMS